EVVGPRGEAGLLEGGGLGGLGGGEALLPPAAAEPAGGGVAGLEHGGVGGLDGGGVAAVGAVAPHGGLGGGDGGLRLRQPGPRRGPLVAVGDAVVAVAGGRDLGLDRLDGVGELQRGRVGDEL